ncbi:MAG: hypothetical protein ACP5K9_01220 [Candidatus Micrarchaeia archaeon]
MNRKLMYIGLALLAISIFAFLGISYIAVPSEGLARAVLLPKGSAFFNMSINGTGFLHVFGFKSTEPVSFYYTNSSAFSAIRAYNFSNVSVAAAAKKLEGRGVFEVLSNATAGIFPYTSYTGYLNITKPSYIANNLTLPAGKYYAIFFNNGTSSANVTVVETALSENSAIYSSVLALFAIVLFIAAIITIVIALVKKSDSGKHMSDAEQDKLAEEAYKRIGGKGE